ncbi:MAG: hypothetical protein IT380_22355 [Myxococcales bacterium]|nr:hypothetical protein [Myxococcales bacterium]
MPEVKAYLDAVAFAEARSRERESIVNASLASAVEAHFGDSHRTRRTRGDALFHQPADEPPVGVSVGRGGEAAAARIEAFRDATTPRPRASIPH